jgi:Concanavalin A-like lectin/glucanases superfamily/Immunoglobulin domain
MKGRRSNSPNNRVRKVACTVSAAALMLGVSEAATVGLHFQTHYCGDSRYTGFPVTMTAFGIGPAGWENLAQMDTGYSCASGTGPYALTNVINTTTSTGGLNPLPNGALTLVWTADTANFSGFAGYGGSPPSYGYNGAPPVPIPTGEWQIYSSFLRDGVNFGPQPGDSPSVDITGLKSLFTNSPFAVQLIASSDSMQYLTNAFVIDATGNTTQSVVYPSTPPVADINDTAWIRGHGGGLSTASGSFNTDHLKIIGNRAAHVGPKTGYNFASTLSGFIITDKPVVTMSPRQVLVCPGDTITWSGYAVGVPPLAYQWRKNGAAIPGATTTTLSITNVSLSDNATYDLRVTNLYGVALSSPVTVDKIVLGRATGLLLDSNPKGPEHDGINHGATWVASSTDGASVTRAGVMSFNAATPSQVTVAGETNFDAGTGTIMFWMRSSGLGNPVGNPATLFDRLNNNGCVLAQNADGTLQFAPYAGGVTVGGETTTAMLSDNHWHHVALVYDQSPSGPLGGIIAFYIDGSLDSSTTLGLGWAWQPGQEIELGLSHDTNSWQAYNGFMDDVRCYNRGLTGAEIASAKGGALVDTNALIMQLNFDTAPVSGLTLTWQCADTILQSADKITGPFSDVPGAVSPYTIGVQKAAKFYRYRGHTPVVVNSNPYLM